MSVLNTYRLFSVNDTEDSEKKYIELHRTLSLMGFMIYPLMYFFGIHQNHLNQEFIVMDFAMAISCLAFYLSSIYSKVVKKNGYLLFQIIAYAAVLFSLYKQSVIGIEINITLLLLISITGTAFIYYNHYLIYHAVVFVGYLYLNFNTHAYEDALIDQIKLLTMQSIILGVFYQFYRIKHQQQTKTDIMASLFDDAPDALLFIDTSKNEIVNCNKRSLELFECYHRERLLFKSLEALFRNTQLIKDLLAFSGKNSDQDMFIEDVLLFKLTGTPFWANAAISRLSFQGNLFIVVRLIDIDKDKKQQMAISENEERYRDIIEHAKDLVFTHDINGRIEMANLAFGEILGYQSDELLGSSITDYMDADSRKAYYQYLDELTEKGECRGFIKLISKSGAIKQFEFSNTAKREHQNKIVIRGIASDVTERVLLENNLTENLAHFRLISENSADMICKLSRSGRFEYISKSGLQLTGYHTDELIETEFIKLVAPQDKDHVLLTCPLYCLQLDQKPTITEFRFIKKNGKEIWVHTVFKPILNEHGAITGYQSSSRDITERKLAELKLAKQAELQKIILNLSSEYINMPLDDIEQAITRSLKELGQFVSADRSYIFAYNWEQMTCSNTHEWCSEGTEPQITELQQVPIEVIPDWIEKHSNGATMYIPDVYALAIDNPIRQLLEPQAIKSLIAIPMMDGKKCIGFIGFDSVREHHIYTDKEETLLKVFSQMLVNVQHRIRLEKRLIEEKNRAEQADNAKSDYLSIISHEIRTPMNGIIGLTGLLGNSQLNPVQKQYVSAVKQSGEHLLVIINDLLDYSKIVAGRMELEYIPFSLRSLLDNIHNTYGIRAGEKHIQFSVDCSNEVPDRLMGDPVRLNQILVNLIGNAIKFTDSGSVVLRIQLLKQLNKGVSVSFIVRDTGIGIAKEKLCTVFESFKQGGSDISRKYGGTGLGLFIVKKLVEASGGLIKVKSAVGEGCEFNIQLDFDIAQADQIVSTQESNLADLTGTRILLAEDNMVNQLLAKDLIRAWGAELTIVENGQQVLDKLDREIFDLVIMDVQMPVLGGLEATTLIRTSAHDSVRNIPIIAMTADAVKQNIQKCFDAGMNDHITKPFMPAELNKIISKNTIEINKKRLFSVSQKKQDSLSQEPVQNMTKNHDAASFSYISIAYLMDYARGKHDFLVKMLQLLHEQTPIAVDGIQKAIEASNWEEVRALAHKVKPNIHLLGNPSMDKLIYEIEHNAEQLHQLNTMPELYNQFNNIYQKAYCELTKALETYSQKL